MMKTPTTRPQGGVTVAAVIPVGPGDSWRPVATQVISVPPVAETLVVGTEPAPDTLPSGVRWIATARGRARQLNAGARASSAGLLWFLHSDSALGSALVPALVEFASQDQPTTVGYFRLGFADDGPPLTALNAWGANLRSRWLDLPFGDQGLLVPRAIWETVGEFDESLPFGEDLDWVVRAKAAGFRLVQLDATMVTSARRYRQAGWLATTLRHLALTVTLARAARRRASRSR